MIAHVAGAAHPPVSEYDVDVIILALDRLDETVGAIQSALSQTGVTRHVTILDQGSMAENLARLEVAVAGRSDATLLRSDRNLGVAEGRNRVSTTTRRSPSAATMAASVPGSAKVRTSRRSVAGL
jgi:GT2 family glycosyltransferase